MQHGKPSLVCDVQGLYRHLIDDFLILCSQGLRKNDFVVRTKTQNDMKEIRSHHRMKTLVRRLEDDTGVDHVGHARSSQRSASDRPVFFYTFMGR
jgi:hypothetical protein